jgi:hypothetical protein
LAGAKTQLSALASTSISSQTKLAIAALQKFYTTYSAQQTFDGAGSTAAPESISNLNNVINSVVMEEFKTYDTAAVFIQEAGSAGSQFATQVQSFSKTLFDAPVQFLQGLTTSIEDSFGMISDGLDLARKYMAAYGVGVTIGVCVGIAVIGALVSLGLLLMWCRETDRCRCGLKLTLVLLCFLLIILCLCAIALIISTILASTICGTLSGILSDGGFQTITDAFAITINSDLTDMIDQCLPQGASGDLIGIMTGGNTKDPLALLDSFMGNLKFFEAVTNGIGPTIQGAQTVLALQQLW